MLINVSCYYYCCHNTGLWCLQRTNLEKRTQTEKCPGANWNENVNQSLGIGIQNHFIKEDFVSFNDLKNETKTRDCMKNLNLFSGCTIITTFFLASPFCAFTLFPVQKWPLGSLVLIWLNYLSVLLCPIYRKWQELSPFPRDLTPLFTEDILTGSGPCFF